MRVTQRARNSRSCETSTTPPRWPCDEGLEPGEAGEVEVVGRLVEQHDVEAAEQQRRERGPRRLPARERRHQRVRPDVEAQLREHRRDAVVEVRRSAREPVVQRDGIRARRPAGRRRPARRPRPPSRAWRRVAPVRRPMWSATVSPGRRSCSCGSQPTKASEGAVVTVPLSGATSPASRRSSVDLPAPLAPTTPTTSPGATVRSRCSKRVRWAWPPARSLATRVALTAQA